jgi:hypothetical protein
LIDGAIDRRAASSPAVADGLVVSTGAVLGEDLDEVVERTREAIELVRLPCVTEPLAGELRAHAGTTALLDGGGRAQRLEDRFVLSADGEEIARLLESAADAEHLLVAGAVPERFVAELARSLRRTGRTLTLTAADSTHVFLSEHGPDFYRRHGLELDVLAPISLRAVTVNPVAPQAHSFDSAEMRARVAQALGDVPVFDVLAPDYMRSPSELASEPDAA